MSKSQDLQDYAIKIASSAILQTGADQAELDNREIRCILGLLILTAGALGFVMTNKPSTWMLGALAAAILGLSYSGIRKYFSAIAQVRRHSLHLVRSAIDGSEKHWHESIEAIQREINSNGVSMVRHNSLEMDELRRMLAFAKSVSFSEAIGLLVVRR